MINNFYVFGSLDRELVAYLEEEGIPVLAKIPRAAALSRAAAAGKSVAEYNKRCHAIPALEELADKVTKEAEKHHE